MKLQLLVPVTVFTSVALMGLIKMRKTELEKEEKRNRFQSTKLRVTVDVLREYESDKVEMQKKLDKVVNDAKALEEVANKLKLEAEEVKGKAEACEGSKKSTLDEAAKAEMQLKGLTADTNNEKEKWTKEMEKLKQTIKTRSPVCDFLKQDSQEGRKACGIEEEPKKEEPKKEEPKKEEPKKEEAKKEEPKKEEPKKEEPKKEEPKKEEPKKEEPKKEEPKKEEAKKEEPKKEEPKAEAPK